MNALLKVFLIIAYTALPLVRGQFTPTCQNWNEKCPLNAPSQTCVVDPCSVLDACPSGFGLTCRSNQCGGCYAICCTAQSYCPPSPPKLCPDGVTYVNTDPKNNCKYALCPNFLKDIEDIIFCPTDVFKCPDGSYVSRDAANDCEFEPCIRDDSAGGLVCTTDVQQCPDGTYVSRNPINNCEFDSCMIHESGSSFFCSTDVRLCPDGSYVSRDPEHYCKFTPCPEEIVCAADVQRCIDGSYVSRDPTNDCAFYPCPRITKIISDFVTGLLDTLLGV